MLAKASPDGLRLSALLVLRLRFERLMRGSTWASLWFARDPAAFTHIFGRYHRAVPCNEVFPSGEARRFHAWVAAARLQIEQSQRWLQNGAAQAADTPAFC